MLKLPPYGSQVKNAIANGRLNEVVVFAGIHAWRKGQAFALSKPSLILPPWGEAYGYDWSVTRYQDVLLIDTGGCEQDYFDLIAKELFYHGAIVIRALTENNEFFKYTR